jgi:hypothetical protein
MSYCRFHWGGSDLYVFEYVEGGIECCGCRVSEQWVYLDIGEFLAHIDEHEKAGHFVPPTLRYDVYRDWQAGEFAEWDDTDPATVTPVEPYTEEVGKAWDKKVIDHLYGERFGPEFADAFLRQSYGEVISEEKWKGLVERAEQWRKDHPKEEAQ